MTPVTADDRFRLAARGYFVYGLVYALGGTYLFWLGLGRGSRWGWAFVVIGWMLVVLIPFLLRRRRAWFERWILSRRDFARIIALSLTVRVIEVGHIAATSNAEAPAPWSGVVTYRAGGSVFALVTLVALVLVARAAWGSEE